LADTLQTLQVVAAGYSVFHR